MLMWTIDFWKATGERMIRGSAIAVLTSWGIGDGLLDAFAMDWTAASSYAVGGAVLSLLMSLAGFATSAKGPAFNKTEKVV